MVTKEWLQQEPEEFELSYNKDGSSYMGIEKIKPKLSELDREWSTRNFKIRYFNPPNGSLWVSCSVELSVSFEFNPYTTVKPENNGTPDDVLAVLAEFNNAPTEIVRWDLDMIGAPKKKITRTLVGAATFDTQDYYDHKNGSGNINWDAIGLSLAIVSAAKNIGPAFGSNLNKGREEFLNAVPAVNDKIKNTLNKLTEDLNLKKRK